MRALLVYAAVAGCGAGGAPPAPRIAPSAPVGSSVAAAAGSSAPAAPAPPPGFVHRDDFPARGPIRAMWSTRADDVWAVGDSTLLHWDGQMWALAMPADAECKDCVYYHSVWASSPHDAWVAGVIPGYEFHGGDFSEMRPDNTNLLHWDGDAWTTLELPAGLTAAARRLFPYSKTTGLGRAISGIHGSGPDDVWITTAPTSEYGQLPSEQKDGVVLHWNGVRLEQLAIPVRTTSHPWSNRPGDAWLVGDDALWHWDGARWTIDPASPPVIGVWGTAAELWIAQRNGAVLHRERGGPWRAVAPATSEILDDVRAGAPTWARLGTRPVRWGGDRWVRVDAPRLVDASVGVGPPGATWVMGMRDGRPAAERSDGNAWTGVRQLARGEVTSMAFAAADDGWAIATEWAREGRSTTFQLLRWDGAAWRAAPDPGMQPFSVWASGPGAVWLAGSRGIARWDGVAWQLSLAEPAGPNHGYGQLWGTSPTDLWAIGCGGAATHWDGTAWQERRIPVPRDLPGVCTAVGGSGPNDVYAMAGTGHDYHWDGRSWSTFDFGLWNFLYDSSGASELVVHAIWGTSANDVWIAGGTPRSNEPLLAHFDGRVWSRAQGVRQNAEHNAELHAIWGRAANDVWAAGAGGMVFHFDGTAWARLPTSTVDRRELFSVAGAATGPTWFGGELGALISLAPDARFPAPPPPVARACDPKPALPADWWLRGDAVCPRGSILHGKPPDDVACKTPFGRPAGPGIHFYPSGHPQHQDGYTDGVLDGPVVSWDDNGTRTFEGTYCNGKLEGRARRWYSNGRLESEETYTHGVLDGTQTAWAQDGRKLGSYTLVRGTGHIAWFFSDSHVKSAEGELVDGEREGEWIDYWGGDSRGHKRGNKRERATYHRGKRHGPSMSWSPDGKTSSQATYIDGVLEGASTSWNKSGVPTRQEYVHGYLRTGGQ